MPAPEPLRRLLDGPPPALPEPVDRLTEWWADLPTRGRIVVGGLGVALVLVAVAVSGGRSPWGPPVAVSVATRDLAPGHVISAEDLRPADWPRDLVGQDPVAADDAVGRPLARWLPAGMPVRADHLARSGVADGLGHHQAAYPLTVPEGVGVAAGMQVDVVAGDASGTGLRLASDARVLAVDAGTVWIAIDREEAPALAGAATWGQVVIVPRPASATHGGADGQG